MVSVGLNSAIVVLASHLSIAKLAPNQVNFVSWWVWLCCLFKMHAAHFSIINKLAKVKDWNSVISIHIKDLTYVFACMAAHSGPHSKPASQHSNCLQDREEARTSKPEGSPARLSQLASLWRPVLDHPSDICTHLPHTDDESWFFFDIAKDAWEGKEG